MKPDRVRARARRSFVAAASVLVALVGCGSNAPDATGPGDASVGGVEGGALPAAPSDSPTEAGDLLRVEAGAREPDSGGSGDGGGSDDGEASPEEVPPRDGSDDRSDAAVTVPPVDGAPDGGCPGLFCEDFEKGALDPAIWSVQANGGQTAAVESTVVAHGRHAIQFHANPNVVSYDFVITRAAPAALRGHHFGRAYFHVTPKPPVAHTGFLFAGTAGFPKLKYLEVAGINGGWQLTFVNLVDGGESYASGGSAPDARWICLEWEFNDTPDRATVFVDGAPSFARDPIAFNGVSTGLVGGFSDFGFGFYAWHPATYPFDVYYDDIVLDTKRIGCLASP